MSPGTVCDLRIDRLDHPGYLFDFHLMRSECSMATRKQLEKQKKARALKKKKITLAKQARAREETPEEKAERRQQQQFDRKSTDGPVQGGLQQGGSTPPMHRPQGG